VIKAECSALLQSAVSRDPSEITLIWWSWSSRHIDDYYQCWKIVFIWL